MATQNTPFLTEAYSGFAPNLRRRLPPLQTDCNTTEMTRYTVVTPLSPETSDSFLQNYSIRAQLDRPINNVYPSPITPESFHATNRVITGWPGADPVSPVQPQSDYANFDRIGQQTVTRRGNGQFIPHTPLDRLSITEQTFFTPSNTRPRINPNVEVLNTTAGRRYRCECGKTSKTIGDLNRHHESRRHSPPSYTCLCGKQYTRKFSLTRHQKKCRRVMLPTPTSTVVEVPIQLLEPPICFVL